MRKIAWAFSPAGISSFFEICDTTSQGKPIRNPELIGARGGGFALERGVHTKVSVTEAKTNKISISINGKSAPEAETTRTTLQMILLKTKRTYEVICEHKIEVPIGAGFGTSAGGALTSGLALSQALDLPLTFNQIGRIAHVAEVECKTGLGTVGPLMNGGCILTIAPGAPGISVIDRIPLGPGYFIVAGVFGPTPTKQVLSSAERRVAVNKHGKETLKAILVKPTLKNFLARCWAFAQETGFATQRVTKLVENAKTAGAIGAAQNMVGESVHALTLKNNVLAVAEAFKSALPNENVLISRIDFRGARLVDKT